MSDNLPSFAKEDWLKNSDLQDLLELLESDGNEARIVGGAVRNAILDEKVGEIDIATTMLPQAVSDIGEKQGYKVVAIGRDHGTIKLCMGAITYEVTTLRRDIKSDGRHAEVIFGTDWLDDAARRDFTINALYIDRHGKLYDPLSGIGDLLAGQVKFIGDAQTRIREDYLRILRFFRFHAYYGTFRPDAEGLKACVRLRDNLLSLSGERIWQEFSRLLQASNPSISVLWMHQSGVLPIILPESQKWGLDVFHGLLWAQQNYKWNTDDSLLRLLSLLPPQAESIEDIQNRFKLSNRETLRLKNRIVADNIDWNVSKKQFMQNLYSQDSIESVEDCLRLYIGRAHINKDTKLEKRLVERLKWVSSYNRPELPVSAKDLMNCGIDAGPKLGEALSSLEQAWIKSDFKLTKAQLLKKL